MRSIFEKRWERRYWDPFTRFEYERDRMSWDPYFRIEKEMDRLSWDPWYRAKKEIERRYNDPEYRWRLYEERRMNGDWFERYLENPRDPVLRDRYESLFRDYSNSGRRELTENERRSLELLRAISLYNRLYDRGPGFWLRLIFKIGVLGFLGYLIWSLATWRPPLP